MTEKPRILFILHLPPPVHGASMVGKYIHDSEKVKGVFDCRFVNLTTASSLEDIGKVRWEKFLQFLSLLKDIRKEVKEMHPDLVYMTPNASGGAFYKDFMVVQLLKGMGCRVLMHYHNKGVATRQDRWLDNLLYRRFFKNTKVMLLAESLYEDVRKYVDRKDVYICPNGIPAGTEGERRTREGKPEDSVPHLLFLSNLIVSKGVLTLLDALAILRERGCQFICDFVGGETQEMNADGFQEEVEIRGLQRCTIYHGRKYGMEKEAFLNDADIFVFPTYYEKECFPIVLLEAMQHGLPCVSTNEGGIPDIIDKGVTGVIVEKRNAKQLADKLELLLNSPALRKQMGENGYRKYKEHFTLAAFEEQFVVVLKEIIFL